VHEVGHLLWRHGVEDSHQHWHTLPQLQGA
jgi:hypothetical protein